MYRFFPHRFRALAPLITFILGILLTIVIVVLAPQVHLPQKATVSYYPELQEVAALSGSFQDYADYFRRLSDRKGAEYAFQVLGRAQIKPGVDIHLLAHTVGDILYKQKGIDAIKLCTPDFRNACSHSVVIGILNEHGEAALGAIAKACKEAPGGKGAYTMCFHGLGHGVLAYTGYDLEKAVTMCQKTGTAEYHNREYQECVGGAVMEMIAGVHDHTAWEKQAPKYFKVTDPLYPCDAAFMPAEVRSICYIQLTPHLFTAAGGNLGNMTPDVYPTAFSYCNALAVGTDERTSCYSGFGKEFVVIAQGRDVRDVGSMQEPALQNIKAWCALAHDAPGEIACNGSALESLFWGGENKPDAALTYCSIASGNVQSSCYQELARDIQYYFSGAPQGAALCKRLPDRYQVLCAN